jgi:AP-3 complex subunit mu
MLTNTPWRRMQPQYPANEIYIEQLERISAILSGSDGSVLRDGSLVTGEMWVDSRLNGAAPDVVLNLFNGQLIEDCDFHPCVRRLRFLRDRTLAFVPPDRRCRLMRYSCTSNNVISPPVSALASISYSSTEGE